MRYLSYFASCSFCLLAALPAGAGAAPVGKVQIDVSDVLGHSLSAKVELRAEALKLPVVIRAPDGRAEQECPLGQCRAYVTIYQRGLPFVVDVRTIEIQEDKPAYILVNVVEGVGAGRPLAAFDRDGDLVLDRVETAEGTDPDDAGSYPGAIPVPYDLQVVSQKEGWYRGELHALSSHGAGAETVAQLVKRAEKLGLDFLAITDRNTVAACMDPAFESKSTVLIPAMEWGSDERGVALIYGPRTIPEMTDTITDAQGAVQRVRAQGGLFAIAHPCFPTMAWQWGLSFVGAVEVWCRGWREVPPVSLEALSKGYQRREDGRLIYSIAQASEKSDHSANGQAALFWDFELLKGLKAAAIGGSLTASPSVPMAQPVTYVYAFEKSLPGILDGLRNGRTFVSAGLDGPILTLTAEVKRDKKMNAEIGGIVPIGEEVEFKVQVKNAKGKKVQLLYNGLPIFAKKVEADDIGFGLKQTPQAYSVYRARVIDAAPPEKGFGLVQVLAMTSPIYAQDILLIDPEKSTPDDFWVQLQNSSVPPVRATEVVEKDGKKWIKVQPPTPSTSAAGESAPPPDPTAPEAAPEQR